jgi:hypothetical protein
MSPGDTASAAERLALKGADFATSDEVAAAIEGGVAAELAFAVMAALGSRFEQLADEDQLTLAELITAAPSAAKATDDTVAARVGPGSLAERDSSPPLFPSWMGGDEAAGSPAASVTADAAEKGALSSPEDDSLIGESPCGDGRTVPVALPADDSPPGWRKFLSPSKPAPPESRRLSAVARRLRGLSLGVGPEVPANGPVNTPGPTGADFARQDPHRAKRYGHIVPHAPVRRTRSRSPAEGKEEEGDDAGSGDQPPPAQGPNPPPGGGDDGDSSGDENEDEEEEEEEEEEVDDDDSEMEDAGAVLVEDPENAGTRKYYTPQTPSGKIMARMFRRFCDLPKKDAHAIVVYFGVCSVKRLAAFQQDHWKDTFVQWQKRHPNRDGSERAMVLSPPQQDRIRCAAWVCHHSIRLNWPMTLFSIEWLRPEHFESIRTQMDREEDGKVTIKMIPELTDVPKWKDRGTAASMSKHFRVFETYLSHHFGVEGFPLDWVVRPSLKPVLWSELTDERAEAEGRRPEFFKLEQCDYYCRTMAPIVPFEEAHHLRCCDEKVIAEWESGGRSTHRSDVFRRDDAIVFHLARIAFADSPGEVHFIPRKGRVQPSGRAAYFACKGQFVGINTARLECDLARDVIQKMRYEGESRSWNWDKHCTKFHQQVRLIDEWAAAGQATAMSAEDQISAFLKTIPKDCKNSELLIAKGIIEGDRSRFPTLVGNVIPHLTLSIESKEPGASLAKRTIANTSSASGQESDKRRRTGGSAKKPRGRTAGKCRVVGGKVVGTLEGLHYTDEVWKAMTHEQKGRVVELRKANKQSRAVRAVSSSTAGPVPMDVSDQLESLTRAVQSLDSSKDSGRRSADRHSNSRRGGGGSRSRSSSRSHGSHQSGAHAGRRKR